MKRMSDAWRIVQGCMASLMIAGAIWLAEQPLPYNGCEICKANFPAWVCWFECLFG